ncbi:TonB-dependent receptor plug domain-containing protein [Lacinutrix undariae]
MKSSRTLGGSTNVVIRGSNSISGNNQALFVIDGVPISNENTNTSNQTLDRGGYDYGNASSDINPDDIGIYKHFKRRCCNCALWIWRNSRSGNY